MTKSMFNYFMDCVTTKKYFSWGGRASRKELWSFVIFSSLFSAIIMTLLTPMLTIMVISIAVKSPENEFLIGIIPVIITYIFLGFSLLIPSFAVLARRFHDINFSDKLPMFSLFSTIICFFINTFINEENYELIAVDIILSLINFFIFIFASTKKTYSEENKYGSPADL